jgi:homoserine dehydrogenase
MIRADLALVGFGNVGRRFARLLRERAPQLARDYGLDCRIVGIATRRHGCFFDPHGLSLYSVAPAEAADSPVLNLGGRRCGDALEVIDSIAATDGRLRVMVETTTLSIEDGRPALTHVERALRGGVHVVTANKGPAAFAYARLHALAAGRNLQFLFEGAVMDGVPIFNLVRETMPAVEVTGFRGVVNSTTNHILTALEDGEEFGPALARMQAEGIAEADPSLDIDGWDAAAKAAALANVLMDAGITPHAVARRGLTAEAASHAREAKARGNRLRLVASASRSADGMVCAAVRPVEIAATDLLATLRGVQNALILQTDLLGEVAITQLSGNLTMTAYALLSDLIAVRRTLD